MKSMKVFGMCCLAIALCAAFASTANAQCGLSLKQNRSVLANALPATASLKAQESSAKDGGDASIVGLWDVKFISDNQIIDEGFDQYHSDGTEILNDTPPPATGNVCLGVWEKTGPRTLKLKHPAWIYDPTNTFVIGRATILENVSLDKGGRTFTGTAVIQFRDLFGNPLGPDLTADLKGERITPD